MSNLNERIILYDHDPVKSNTNGEAGARLSLTLLALMDEGNLTFGSCGAFRCEQRHDIGWATLKTTRSREEPLSYWERDSTTIYYRSYLGSL